MGAGDCQLVLELHSPSLRGSPFGRGLCQLHPQSIYLGRKPLVQYNAKRACNV